MENWPSLWFTSSTKNQALSLQKQNNLFLLVSQNAFFRSAWEVAVHWNRDLKYLWGAISDQTSAVWFTKLKAASPGMMKGSHLVSQVLEKMVTKREVR
jgi:hypothetical protein